MACDRSSEHSISPARRAWSSAVLGPRRAGALRPNGDGPAGPLSPTPAWARGSVLHSNKFRTMWPAFGPDGQPLPDAQRLDPPRPVPSARRVSTGLPQLWNVPKGELSLVGPRPLLIEFCRSTRPQQARRHEVPPGITGWAQVNGRNAISSEQKFAYDVWYVDHWSFGLDLTILALTARKVVCREGISAAARRRGRRSRARASPARSPEHGNCLGRGSGGHAKVVIATLLAADGFKVAGILDDDATRRGHRVLGVEIMGDTRL